MENKSPEPRRRNKLGFDESSEIHYMLSTMLKNKLNMKFSIRVLALICLIVIVVFVLLLWGSNIYDFSKMEMINKLKKDTFSGELAVNKHVRKIYESEHAAKNVFDASKRVYEIQNQTCDLALQSVSTKTDINTYTVIHKIDAVYRSNWVENPAKYMGEHFLLNKSSDVVDIYNRKKRLNVIVIPNSHSDPGWLNTLDGYFQVQTQDTLNNMVEKLLKYRNMTFVWPESVFLSMWWRGVDDGMKLKVKDLIQRNQLEIVVGSWVVPDEATTHYFALIDQMIEGHQWLENNIGVKPMNSWSLDPFGYSPSLAYLYKKAGLKHMVILRVHQFVKEYFQGKQIMEFNWRQHWDSKGTTDIFTTMLPYMLYNIKNQCGPDPFECRHFDFRNINGEVSESLAENITNENVEKYAGKLLTQYSKKNNLYNHNVVLVPLGDDFRYDREIEWDQQYTNYQKLFNYMNSKEEWNVYARFGTLNDYFNEVEKESKDDKLLSFPSLQGDFFPYTDRDEEYWTGYFTTRAYDKNFERELEQNLRAAEIFNVLAKAVSTSEGKYLYYRSNIMHLTVARRGLALFQHHDGITGTARGFVVADYEHRLQRGLDATKKVIESATQFLMAKNRDQTSFMRLDADQPKSLYMLDPGIKFIDFTEDGNRSLVLCNPTVQHREDVITVTVNYDYLEVYDEDGKIVMSQINPFFDDDLQISGQRFLLIFLAKLPPLSLVKYTVVFIPSNIKPKENLAAFISFANYKIPVLIPKSSRFISVAPRGQTHILENDYLRTRFSARSGYLQSVTTKAKLATKQIHTELLMYKARRSGAYIFAPAGPAVDTEMYNLPPVMVIKGPVVSEIHILQREKVCKHVVKLYNSTGLLGTVLEINNVADMTLKDDKELVLKFSTDMKDTDSTFFTDLNGLHSIKRKKFKNFPKEASYFPMTSFAYIENQEIRMSVLSAQPLGVSSQENGSLEVMIDRKLLYDDGRGLGEGVVDAKRTPSQFFLLFEKPDRLKSVPVNDPWGKTSASDNSNIASFPSLHTYLLLEQLQHHIIIFHDKSKGSLIRDIFQPLNEGVFPCDTKLVNLRGILPGDDSVETTSSKSQKKLKAALILHRVGYDCSFPVIGFECARKSTLNQMVPAKLFKDIQIEEVLNVSLSLMHEYGSLNLDYPLMLNPMDITTFKITLRNSDT